MTKSLSPQKKKNHYIMYIIVINQSPADDVNNGANWMNVLQTQLSFHLVARNKSIVVVFIILVRGNIMVFLSWMAWSTGRQGFSALLTVVYIPRVFIYYYFPRMWKWVDLPRGWKSIFMRVNNTQRLHALWHTHVWYEGKREGWLRAYQGCSYE